MKVWPAPTLDTTPKLKSIRFFIVWFGRWPGWMRFFLASCAANPTVDWLIITDCPDRDDLPANVTLRRTTLEDYRAFIDAGLGITCAWDDAYKLCDLRPAFGRLHADDIAGFDYWGYGDLDVVYGDMRHFLSDEVLTRDIVSGHAGKCAGHFVLVRNEDRLNRAFERVRGWKEKLAAARHHGFDERHWSNILVKPAGHPLHRRLKMAWESPFMGCNGWFEEQYSTCLPGLVWIDGTTNFPTEWIWDHGHLTTNVSGDREFLYCHFSNWQSGRWTANGRSAWADVPVLDQCPPGPLTRFKVTPKGFLPE